MYVIFTTTFLQKLPKFGKGGGGCCVIKELMVSEELSVVPYLQFAGIWRRDMVFE
jgi:hypothetical protein